MKRNNQIIVICVHVQTYVFHIKVDLIKNKFHNESYKRKHSFIDIL